MAWQGLWVLVIMILFGPLPFVAPLHATDLPDMTGRIVCERPDGIYMQKIGSAPEKLVPGGKYPRWAADGTAVAYVLDHTIGLITLADRQPVTLARASSPHAVAFHPDGKSVWFTDGDTVKSVNRKSGVMVTVAQGKRYRELDTVGSLLAGTVHGLGFYVEVVDLVSGNTRRIARGCSASLSPAGDLVTVNGGGHTRLDIYDARTGERKRGVDAPAGERFDNHFWSNHSDWIVSIKEGRPHEILLHQVSSNRSWRMAETGECDRADLFVEKVGK